MAQVLVIPHENVDTASSNRTEPTAETWLAHPIVHALALPTQPVPRGYIALPSLGYPLSTIE